MDREIVDVVRSRYGSVAKSDLSSHDEGVRAVAEAFGYSRSSWPPYRPKPTWACLAAIPRPLPA